jgi:hypothetical protein
VGGLLAVVGLHQEGRQLEGGHQALEEDRLGEEGVHQEEHCL